MAIHPATTRIAALPPAGGPDEAAQMGMEMRELVARQRWFIREFDPIVALAICEDIASGKTLDASTGAALGRVRAETFLRWCVRVPELGEVYKIAREISAHMLEDEALGKARELFSGTPSQSKVSAYNVALGQLRWSAGKRHPKEYSEKAQTTFTVPVQINTSIPLVRGGELEDSDPNAMFTVEAQMGGGAAELAPEAPPVDNPFARMEAVVEQWKELGGREAHMRKGLDTRRKQRIERLNDAEWEEHRAEGKGKRHEYFRKYMQRRRAAKKAQELADAQGSVDRDSLSSVGGQLLSGQPEHLESGVASADPLPGEGDSVRNGDFGDEGPHNDSKPRGGE